ncbi:MAG TPA: hypothetical protein VMG41_09420 [Gemmatimonadales bacterium]|nr:hypothetical protein [Gemmatimonadales bacterium]
MAKTPNKVRSPRLEPRDWLLLALERSRSGLTPVQLQKVLFLLGERKKATVHPGFYRFEPYNYGPFCRQIYNDADLFALTDFISVDYSRGNSLRRYQLTPEGQQAAQHIATRAPQDGLAYLNDVVRWAQSLPFNDLVRAIYEAYPAMRAKSVFRD